MRRTFRFGIVTTQTKRGLTSRNSSVNVTKSFEGCEFGYIY